MITLSIPSAKDLANNRIRFENDNVSISDVFLVNGIPSFSVHLQSDEFDLLYPFLTRYRTDMKQTIGESSTINYRWDAVKTVAETKTKQLPNPWHAYVPYTDRQFKFVTIANATVCTVLTDYGIAVYVAESINKLMRMSTEIERLFTELSKTDLHDSSIAAYSITKNEFELKLTEVKAKLKQYV